MPTIIFSPSAQLSQVEGFPPDCERTVKGALHVRPGATCIVSDGEAAHLKASGVDFTVAGESKPKALPAAKKASPTPKGAPASPELPLPVSGSGAPTAGSQRPAASSEAKK